MDSIKLAGCVIRNEAGKILLLHRNKSGVTQWELPGGKLEKGETASTAAIREVHEELGVEVTEAKRLGRASFTEGDRKFSYEWFEANIASGVTPSVREPEVFDNLQYWELSELKKRNDLSPNLKNLLASGVLEAPEKLPYARRMLTVIGVGYLFLVAVYVSPFIIASMYPDEGEAVLVRFANFSLAMLIGSFLSSLVMVVLAVRYIMRRRLLGPARMVTVVFVALYLCLFYSPVIYTIISFLKN